MNAATSLLPSERELAASAARVMARCDELRQVSGSDEYYARTYLSPEHKAANQRVGGWMAEAGLESWEDAVGNIWGRYPAKDPAAKTFVIGSHLDTVIDAGTYDGVLGVLLGLELASYLKRREISLPFHLDVVGFGDEEGVRFGATLLGSRALAGKWEEDLLDLTDAGGVSLAQAMTDFGLDPGRYPEAARPSDVMEGYLEVHIEQGPVLEDNNLPLGVVTSIAGARRFSFLIEGAAGHAGTVPMVLRRDALVGASQCISSIEKVCALFDVVATVGSIQSFPGAVNVIPGQVQFSLDIRSAQDRSRDLAFDRLIAQFQKIVDEKNLFLSWQEIHTADSVPCDSRLQRRLEQALTDAGQEVKSLFSGAGHDAMAMKDFAPLAMLFVRCAAGISHHPDEAIEVEDVRAALDVLGRFALAELPQVEESVA